jgi:hypothetical protein
MNNYIFDCGSCKTRCDGISIGVYNFRSDAEYSEAKENYIIEQINLNNNFEAKKCELPGYPDIEVLNKSTNKKFYIEIKAQRRTFMAVERKLPDANLKPSETLALNRSDLLRYFDIKREIDAKIFIIWCLENRPCIVPQGQTYFYYQDINKLELIWQTEQNKRTFRRASGRGDVVNGQHRGVVVNYHFSLNELEKLDDISNLLQE